MGSWSPTFSRLRRWRTAPSPVGSMPSGWTTHRGTTPGPVELSLANCNQAALQRAIFRYRGRGSTWACPMAGLNITTQNAGDHDANPAAQGGRKVAIEQGRHSAPWRPPGSRLRLRVRVQIITMLAAIKRGLTRRPDGDRGYAGLLAKNPLHAHCKVEWRRDPLLARSAGGLAVQRGHAARPCRSPPTASGEILRSSTSCAFAYREVLAIKQPGRTGRGMAPCRRLLAEVPSNMKVGQEHGNGWTAGLDGFAVGSGGEPVGGDFGRSCPRSAVLHRRFDETERAMTERRFPLRMPMRTCPAIEQACESTEGGLGRAGRVFLAAEDATSMEILPEFRDLLARL